VGEDRDNPGGTAVPPPLIYLGGLTAGLALQTAHPRRFLPPRAARVTGALLLGGGAMLSL
jgi:protein-S-isoprenylcysteine O-methyltransferase Ste14